MRISDWSSDVCSSDLASDVSVATGGGELDPAVEQLLLGIQDIQHVARSDGILGANTLDRKLIRFDRYLRGANHLQRRIIARESRACVGDHGALHQNDLLQRLAVQLVCSANTSCRGAALVKRNCSR